MGHPMLAALRLAGFHTDGFDVRHDIGVGTDITAFAQHLSILLTVVRDEAETDALLFDNQKIIAQAPDINVIIICSTLSPNYVKSLRARIPDHIALIDAPMSGAQVRAENGTLSFMLGGNPDALAQSRTRRVIAVELAARRLLSTFAVMPAPRSPMM